VRRTFCKSDATGSPLTAATIGILLASSRTARVVVEVVEIITSGTKRNNSAATERAFSRGVESLPPLVSEKMLRSIVELVRTVELIDARDKGSGEARQRNRSLAPRQDDIVQLAAGGIGWLAGTWRQVDVFLIGPPGPSGQGQEGREMKHTVLIVDLIRRTAIRRIGIIVIGYQKIVARLRPKVVGFRRADMRIIHRSAWTGR
jgi:hypothetical protein